MKSILAGLFLLISNPTLPGLPSKPVDAAKAVSTNEVRNFVPVPLDYNDPNSPIINVFFRWIPSTAGSSAPTLIYMNGGPGYPSSTMRKLDYDYASSPEDPLTNLLTLFNIVLVDQRGTDGLSFPLDMAAADLELEQIGRYFNQEAIALDHARIIDTLINLTLVNPNHFYIIGHSFGTTVAASYVRLLSEGKITTSPTGIILSCGDVTGDPLVSWLGAHQTQRQASEAILQYSIAQGLLPFDQLMIKVQAHLASLGFNPDLVHFAYGPLIGGKVDAAYDTVAGLLNIQSSADVEAFLNAESDAFNFLNHVVSIQALYGGRLASEMSQMVSAADPMESWIIDPLKAFVIEEGHNAAPKAKLVELVRAGKLVPPAPTTIDQFKTVMANSKILFHYARADIVVGAEAVEKMLYTELGEDLAKQTVVLTAGGHRDIRTPEGAQLLKSYFGL